MTHGSLNFRPPFWLSGGHRQTLAGYLLRRSLRWSLPTSDLPVDAGDGVRLLLRASWQPGPPAAHPAIVVVHGLGGSDASTYCVSLGRLAYARGFHVLRMNLRGCGDGEALCPLLYDAGLDRDLLAVVDEAARRVKRVALAGFSLGGNLALLMAGRRRAALPGGLVAIAAASPPVDLARCADALERRENRIYERYFVGMLRDAYRQRSRSRPDLFPPALDRDARTIREFDDRVTARFGGYRDVADYYERASAGPWLAAIDRPTLLLTAADDPLIPVASLSRWPLTPDIRREITPTGGHLGFVARSQAPGSFWAADRVIDFLEAHVG